MRLAAGKLSPYARRPAGLRATGPSRGASMPHVSDLFRFCKNRWPQTQKKRTVRPLRDLLGGMFLEKITNLFDYEIFARVIKAGSLSAAARELHSSPAMISKRLT